MKEISEEMELEIMNFCESKIDEIDPYVLKNSLVLRNELLDFLFLMALIKLEKEGNYDLTYEELNHHFMVKQSADALLSKIRNGIIDIEGIEKNGFIIIKNNYTTENIENND